MATTESLMFDADRVQEEQEEELKQEEDERQQELKDLLANAFDDIEADETCSFASDDSHDSGRHSDEICQQNRWTSGKIDYHASTPVSETRAPPLITPVIRRKYNTSPPTAPTHLYNNHGSDTIYQEPDHTTALYDSNITQQSETDSAPYQPYHHHHQQPVDSRYTNGSYPSSHTSHSSSDINSRRSSNVQQHSPLYRAEQQGYNSTGERHLTGSSDVIDSTVFVECAERKASSEQLQDRYFQEGAGAKSAQLGILYQAKSRQLQELQEKYELLQLESSKEIRILRHEVALLQGSKQGCEGSLKHTQTLLTQNKEARFELQKKLDSMEDEKNKLGRECTELRDQLAAAEVSIESLNAQIFALGSSDTVERMREQHESIVSTLRKESEGERHELNQQLAMLQQRMHAQKEEVDSTMLLLKADMEAITKERVDHADTVNRLTLSLKESQRQIQDLLNESCGTELSKVKVQLQQCNAAKSMSEQLCSSLQREVSDLKEQITLYEGAQATHNLLSNCTIAQDSEAYDDTLVELGIKPLRKSSSCRSLGPRKEQSSEETILILRQELQKCLTVVKDKRAELSSLRVEAGQRKQEELRTETELGLLRDRLEKSQVQLKEVSIELNLYKSAAGEGKSLAEVKLGGQMESLTNEKAILQEEVKCLSERLELVAENEAKLGEINAELNCKIAEMIDDFDRDKKAALQRCQDTLESHNQTVKDMMRSELEAEYEMKLRRLESQYKSELTSKSQSNDELNKELRQVKELYVQVCSEKNKLEEEITTAGSGALPDLQQRLADAELLKSQTEQVSLLEQKLADMKAANAELEIEKTTLSETIDRLSVELRICREQQNSLDKCQEDGSNKAGAGQSACRELFTNGHSDSRSRTSSQSRDSSGGRSSANSSRHESKSLEDQLKNEKTRRADLQDELLRTRADSEAARSELNEMRQQLSEVFASGERVLRLEEELRQLKVIIADLRGDNQKLDKLLSGERVQLSLARDDVVTLQNQVSEYKCQLGADGSQMDKLHKVMVALEESKKGTGKVQVDLEAEMAAHSLAKQELESLRNRLNCESESLRQQKEKLSAAVVDLQKERRAHLQTKSEVDRQGAELQAEKTSHNRAKIELSKLRAELSEKEEVNKGLVQRDDLNKVQAALDAEKKAHQKVKQALAQLESSVSSEKVSSSLTKSELDKTLTALQEVRAELLSAKRRVEALTAELDKVRAEKSEHSKVHAELENERLSYQKLKQDFEQLEKLAASEKIQLSVALDEAERRKAALQAEEAAHKETKKELQRTLTRHEADRANMVKRSELASVQLDLEREEKAHQQVRESLEELENSTLSEKSFQSLTRSTLANVQQQLQVERSEHQQTQVELSKLELALQAEQSTHNQTRIQLVTVETELSTERSNQGELRRSLEKVRSNYGEQEAEMELLRANQSKDCEVIAQMKSQRQQEKGQLEGLKASHSQLVSDLNEAKTKLIRKESETSQLKAGNSRLLSELDLLSKRVSEDKQKLVEQHAVSLKRAVAEAEQRWREQSSSPAPDVVAENKFLKEKLNSLEAEVESCEKLLSQADEHFEQQLKKIRTQMQEEYTVQIDKLTSISNDNKNTLKLERTQQQAVRERLEKEAAELRQELTTLTKKSEELEGKCKDYQSCAEDLRRNLKSLSTQTDSLKAANKKAQAELSKTTAGYENKMEQLSQQLQLKDRELSEGEHEHALTVQSLKQKMVALRNEQTIQQACSRTESISCACQTLPIDVTGKQYYDIAVQSIRVEVLNYVEETNRNAAKLIRCEIHKAKQSTARQLRNYYVKCFKQSLQDSRATYEEKLNKLERTLDNAVAAAVTPSNINTDSILSVPEQLLTDSFRCRPHSETCPDHTMAELYSRGPTPVISDRQYRASGRLGRLHTTAADGRQTPVIDDRSDRTTPVPTDTDSRYSYVPLRNVALSSTRSVDRNNTAINTTTYNTDSSDIIRELGLDNTETSPPRWYNPPPEKLPPSPDRQSSTITTGSEPHSKFIPLRTMSSKR